MNTKLVMVLTTDGAIGRDSKHTPMGWTSAEDKKLFQQLTKEAGVLIMGENTYQTIGSPLPGRLNIVLTYEKHEDQPGVLEYKQGDVKEILKELESRGFTQVIIAGGTFVNSLFLKENLIDEIQITIEPKIFGSGLRLFDKIEADVDLELVELKKLNENTINLRYRILK
jgi:dihydrofolate reductase